jgi:DNA-binding NtrC family response regulator
MSYTVLIVDDEDTFRKNTEEFLTARGYETRGAATLAEARDCL